MVQQGTTATLRVTGVPGGHPAEQEGTVKVRFVDPSVEVMSDFDAPLLSVFGGVDSFVADNTKFEWIARDLWTDRFPLGASINAAVTQITTTGNIAHRFPRGMVLKVGDELMWIKGQVNANTLEVVRGYTGTTPGSHTEKDEVRIVGFTEVEGTDFVLRGSALHEVAHNFFSIIKQSVSESWMQAASNTYVRSGPTMPEMMADNIKQSWISVEAQVIEGRRYAGSGEDDPPMSGGLRFFGTSANGAIVEDASAGALSRELFDGVFDALYMQVGLMNLPRTIICGIGAQRRLHQAYIEPFSRTSFDNTAGANRTFTSFTNEYGRFEIIGPYKRIPDDELWIVNPATIDIGRYGEVGRLHEVDLTTMGDYNRKALFGIYGNRVRGIPGIGHIHNFDATLDPLAEEE